jgi:hypothetical protein
MALAPKPVTLTQVDAVDYEGAGEPQPLVVVGDVPGAVEPQPAIADLAGGADLPTTVTKVNAILAALRAAGVIAP